MWRSIVKGRLFGHPIHPMLVHFPTALFTAGFVFDLIGKLFQDDSFYFASFYVLLLGLATGLLAALFGLMDYAKLGNRPEAFSKASWHAGIQFVVIMLFGIFAALKYQHYPEMSAPGIWQLVAMGFGVGLMLMGNYLGGELVFRHKVGFDEISDS